MGGSPSQVSDLSLGGSGRMRAVCAWPGAGGQAASGGCCPPRWAQGCLASPVWAPKIPGHIFPGEGRSPGPGKVDVLQVQIRQALHSQPLWEILQSFKMESLKTFNDMGSCS